MQGPLKITFRDLDPSEAIEAKIREAFAKLEEVENRITGCQVTVESRHRRHHKGNLYNVRIDLVVPGAEIAVSRDPEQNHAHEDVYVAIRDAFNAARRRLLDAVKRKPRRQEPSEVPAETEAEPL